MSSRFSSAVHIGQSMACNMSSASCIHVCGLSSCISLACLPLSLYRTREEYIAVVQQVKASVPQPGPHGHRVKSDLLHVDLATKLEQRIDAITSHCEVRTRAYTMRVYVYHPVSCLQL